MSTTVAGSFPAVRPGAPGLSDPAAGKPSAAYLREAKALAAAALAEDVGRGDVTTAMFAPDARGTAVFLAKQAGVVSGLEVAKAVFRHMSPGARFTVLMADGTAFSAGDILAEVRAPMRALLTGERVALNFLQRLSGVATMTARHVAAAGDPAAGPDAAVKIVDTRKTTPLLRLLEKTAVRHGGGHNHRMRLDDMAMLKNNHIDRAGSVAAAMQALRAAGFDQRRTPLAIEARDPAETAAAVEAGADLVLLDNMTPAQAAKCAALAARRAAERNLPAPQVEVSGGITLATIARYARIPGVHRISVGALTHSAPAIDISFRIVPDPE